MRRKPPLWLPMIVVAFASAYLFGQASLPRPDTP